MELLSFLPHRSTLLGSSIMFAVLSKCLQQIALQVCVNSYKSIQKFNLSLVLRLGLIAVTKKYSFYNCIACRCYETGCVMRHVAGYLELLCYQNLRQSAGIHFLLIILIHTTLPDKHFYIMLWLHASMRCWNGKSSNYYLRIFLDLIMRIL